MGKTSSAVKDRYNAKAYDEIKVRVMKGQKDKIKLHAESCGESVNAFIARAIAQTMQHDIAPGEGEKAPGAAGRGEPAKYPDV